MSRARPVPYRHHPAPIREALQRHGIRPMAGEPHSAYRNCQRFIVEAVELQHRLIYCEGTISTHYNPVPHAWLWLDRQTKVDLTVPNTEDFIYTPAGQFPLDQVRCIFERHGGRLAVDARLTKAAIQRQRDVRPVY